MMEELLGLGFAIQASFSTTLLLASASKVSSFTSSVFATISQLLFALFFIFSPSQTFDSPLKDLFRLRESNLPWRHYNLGEVATH